MFHTEWNIPNPECSVPLFCPAGDSVEFLEGQMKSFLVGGWETQPK